MIGEIIKEYLVGLGVKIDKPGFAEFDSTINKTTDTISKATGGWGKNFMTASAIVATAIAGVTSAAAGLMTSVAKQDLAMDKYARSMMVSKNAAWEMKQAVDALGESVQDIQLNPELFSRYKALISDGRNMKVGGDYSQTMKDFRGLIFEFTRLKQEAGYALQWVGYYLMKHLSKPLAEGKEKFQNINDSIIKTMSVWTEKIARTMVYIINIGRSFWSFIKAIGKSVYELWDAFPHGIKIATAALTGFFMLLKVIPMGRMIALVSTFFLLIDDYFGHMEGRQAAFGEFWDKLNDGIAVVKEALSGFLPTWDELGKSLDQIWPSIQELGNSLLELGESIGGYLVDLMKAFFKACEKHGVVTKITELFDKWVKIGQDLINTTADIIKFVSDLITEIGQSEEVQEWTDAIAELLSVVLDLISVITDLANDILRAFFGELSKTGVVFSFKEAIKGVQQIASALVRTVSSMIKRFTSLFKMMKDNKTFKGFWEGLGKMVGVFSDILLGAIGRVGKLGQALLALVRGDFSIARKLADDALFGKVEAGERKFDFSGGNAPTGVLSSAHEGGVGTVSTGEGDPYGGISYGAFQFSSKIGVVDKFLDYISGTEIGDRLSNAGAVNSQSFKDTWKQIAQENPEQFFKMQQTYAREAYYEATANSVLNSTGVDIDKMSRAMKEVAWSTGVHHGVGGATGIFKDAFKNATNETSEEELIREIYKQRYWHADAALRDGFLPRFNIEVEEAVAMWKQEQDLVRQQREAGRPKPEGNEQQGFAIENPPPEMRNPTFWERLIGQNKALWDDLAGGSKSASLSIDPAIINGFMGKQYNSIGNTTSGFTVFNNVSVGGVTVSGSNLNANDVGNAVATKTTSSLEQRSQYVFQNRTLGGGSTWT